jgi:hypothetical protein
MKIKFLQDYRGVLTNEQYFRQGDIVDGSKVRPEALIAEGRAEALVEKKKTAPKKKAAVKK